MTKKIGLLTVLAMAAATSAFAFSGWYVDPAGDDNNSCTAPGPSDACKTINAAIGKASAGETIVVAAGFYDEQVSITKTLTLLGVQTNVDARFRSGPESIINNSCGPVQIHADHVFLDGFTIQGASDTSSSCFMAGIWMNPVGEFLHGGALLFNNIIQNNITGIELDNDPAFPAFVFQSLIRNNNNPGPGRGNGIEVSFGLQNAVIAANTFSGNANASISIQSMSNNITITTNTLDAGIGLFSSSDVDINFNTSIGNTVGATVYLGGGNSSVIITDNVLLNGVEAIVVENPYSAPPDSIPANTAVVVNNNCISGNSKNGLRVAHLAYTGGVLNAESNNWGAASGPSGTGLSGTGDKITDPDGVVDSSSFLADGSCPPRGTPAEATSVSVTCDPSSVAIGVATTCTATVTNTSVTQSYGSPHGTAKFGLGAGLKGTFSPSANCTLTPMGGSPAFSECSVTFTATSGPGTALVHASYTSSDGPSWKNAGNSPDFGVAVTSDITKVSVVCSPNSVKVGVSTTCLATVTDVAPTPNNGSPLGTSTFSLGAGVTGTFSVNPCTLAPATLTTSSCTVTFTPTSGAGKARIRANYSSSDITEWADAGNSPDFSLTATVDSTKVSVDCRSSVVRLDHSITCRATVTDTAILPFGNPLGTANFSLGAGATGTFDPPSGICDLEPADSIISSCFVTFTPTSVGKAKIRASYDSGDLTKWADAGNSPDFSVTVPVDSTSVSVSCDSPVQLGEHPATCTVTVTDTSSPYYGPPEGTSKFSVAGVTGTFSGNPCTLAPVPSTNTSTCSVDFTPTSVGTAKIHANYTSTDPRWANAPNSPDFLLTVTPMIPY